MRRFLLFIVFIQLAYYQPLFSQSATPTNEKDSAQKESKKTKIEFFDWQDSTKREKLLQQIEQNGKSLDAFLSEMREKEKKEERRKWIRIGAAVIFLFAIFVAIARSARKKKSI